MTTGVPITQDWIIGLAPASSVPAEEQGEEGAPEAPAEAAGRAERIAALTAAHEADSEDLDVLKTLAELHRQAGDFDAALEAWEKVLAVNPTYRRGLSRFVAVGARGSMDWPRIWTAVRKLEPLKKGGSPYRNPQLRRRLDALFTAPHPTAAPIPAVDALAVVETLEEMARGGRHLKPTVLTLVLFRLQFSGHFALGFRLRELGMRRRLAGALTKPPADSLTGLRNQLKALVYTGQPEVAAELAGIQRRRWEDPLAVRRIEKMRADALLLAGHPEAYWEYSEAVRAEHPLPGERGMAELVTGRRVAVVGPADTGDRLGELIDSYDVVVRPRFQPQFLTAHTETMGSRTDLAYYSGFDMDQFLHDAEAAVDRGELQLVNARPFTYATHAPLGHPWLRFYRHDYSLCPAGGQLGVQRMAYDLMQFRPAEIAVFNADLYTGSRMFTAGWRPQDSFGPGSHINDIVAAHDIRFDFTFTQALRSAGVLTAHGRTREVLDLSLPEYLQAVEEAGVLR